MSYLLDTCILSKLQRIAKYPDLQLQNWIEQHSANLYYISVFSLAEIQSGIAKIDGRSVEGKKQKKDLENWFFGELIPEFEGRIINFDIKLALRWGSMMGECKRRGINLAIIDSLIAVSALHHELIVVTENCIDFEPTGVILVNPWTCPL